MHDLYIYRQIKELEDAMSQPLGFTIQALFISTICMGIALHHSWKLTLAILTSIPLVITVTGILSLKLPALVHQQKIHFAEFSKSVHRTVSNISTVKCLNGEAFELGVFSSAVRLAAEAYRAQVHNQAIQMGVVQLITLSMFVQGFCYGGYLVIAGKGYNGIGKSSITPGDIMTTFWSCLMAVQHFQLIVPHILALEKGKIAAMKLKSMMSDMREENCERRTENGMRLPEFKGCIKFMQVCYPQSSYFSFF